MHPKLIFLSADVRSCEMSGLIIGSQSAPLDHAQRPADVAIHAEFAVSLGGGSATQLSCLP